jgi:hypothetical protein
MNNFADLNYFGNTSVSFTAANVNIDRAVGNVFQHVPVAWNTVRTFGALTNTGVQLVFTMNTPNVTVTFPDSASATHALNIVTVGSTTTVNNIRDILDYNAARAQINPAGSVAGNVNYTVAYTNTNNAINNFTVDYVGVPV